MRLLAGIIVFAVLPRTAGAEVYPVKALTGGLALAGYNGTLGGQRESGLGPQVDIGVRVGRRTHLVVESGVSWMHVGEIAPVREGLLVRGAAGPRWVARSFDFGGVGALEMHLDALVGANKVWWDDGGTLARPELALGIAIQMRKYSSPYVSFGFRVRLYWAPADDDAMPAARCTNDCEPRGPVDNTGMMFAIGASL